ncbi:ester cyclase [Kitasatospora purpeofusca]|uniref:ester cyclase n=1 Tax=Kitasatospora purpeofusca TaxID=67352 RepID=UPI002E0E50E3|nr:ester cyclase [Kitasatospora purpeofusca]WSR29685.1 ester cyclase [Kitasatospora purpeofusca]WSR37911.1 ester cyclase [Kitasatospora purpeofusca]
MSTYTSQTAPVDVARIAAAALNAGDLDRFAELVHEDVAFDILPFGERHGRLAARGFFAELRGALPDFDMTVEAVTGDARCAAVAWRITGTFNGERFQGFEPNGRAFDIRGIDFMDIDSGRVRHDRIAFDGAEWARQLGLLPPRGSAAESAAQAVFNLRTRIARRWRERRHAAGKRTD